MLSMYVKHFKSQVPPLVVLFCKIPISIPLKSETVFTGILRSGIRYGAGTRVPVYSPTGGATYLPYLVPPHCLVNTECQLSTLMLLVDNLAITKLCKNA